MPRLQTGTQAPDRDSQNKAAHNVAADQFGSRSPKLGTSSNRILLANEVAAALDGLEEDASQPAFAGACTVGWASVFATACVFFGSSSSMEDAFFSLSLDEDEELEELSELVGALRGLGTASATTRREPLRPRPVSPRHQCPHRHLRHSQLHGH
jgi:hypothetical protein